MLSRRDKIYIQPWEDRRFKDHKSKVKSALPAIDSRAPPARPHVVLKLKQCQREADRKEKIQRDNYSLLQRLNAIMRAKRLDNCWTKPLPDFHHKVGVFYKPATLGSRVAARAISEDSHAVICANVKCYACDLKKKSASAHMFQLFGSSESDNDILPSISTRTNGC